MLTRPYAQADSGTWIEASGVAIRLLSDDDETGRHQRFVIDAGGRRTLLVLHNVDLAPRVPVGLGERVSVRGLYEWNERGGLVHWTHRDPMGNEDGGFIRHRRQTYR